MSPLFRNPSSMGIFLSSLTSPTPTPTPPAPTPPAPTPPAPTPPAPTPPAPTPPSPTPPAPTPPATVYDIYTYCDSILGSRGGAYGLVLDGDYTNTGTTTNPSLTSDQIVALLGWPPSCPPVQVVVPGTVYIAYCLDGQPYREQYPVNADNILTTNINEACAVYTSILQFSNATSIDCSISSPRTLPTNCGTTPTPPTPTPTPPTTTYWSTGCCTGIYGEYQVIGTSNNNTSEAASSMNLNCEPGYSIQNAETGSYTTTYNIPVKCDGRICPSSNIYGITQGGVYSGSCPDGSCPGCTNYQDNWWKCSDGSSGVKFYTGLGCSTPTPTPPAPVSSCPPNDGGSYSATNVFSATCQDLGLEFVCRSGSIEYCRNAAPAPTPTPPAPVAPVLDCSPCDPNLSGAACGTYGNGTLCWTPNGCPNRCDGDYAPTPTPPTPTPPTPTAPTPTPPACEVGTICNTTMSGPCIDFYIYGSDCGCEYYSTFC